MSRSVGQQLGKRRGRQHTLGPDLDLLRRRVPDALLRRAVPLLPEAPPQLAKEKLAFALHDALSDALLDRLAAPVLDNILSVHQKLLVIMGLLRRITRHGQPPA